MAPGRRTYGLADAMQQQEHTSSSGSLMELVMVSVKVFKTRLWYESGGKYGFSASSKNLFDSSSCTEGSRRTSGGG